MQIKQKLNEDIDCNRLLFGQNTGNQSQNQSNQTELDKKKQEHKIDL
jgi:hypothetical protein